MKASWIGHCALGEAIGIAVVAVAYAASERGLLATAPAVLVAGAFEGLALGALQARVLSRLGVGVVRWIVATVAAAVAGYGLSLLGGAGQGAAAGEASAEPSLAVVLAAAFALGAAMGAIMGVVQGWAARRHIVVSRWVVANILGWGCAMVAIFFGSSLATNEMPLVMVAVLGGASGAIAGGAVGVATQGALPKPFPA